VNLCTPAPRNPLIWRQEKGGRMKAALVCGTGGVTRYHNIFGPEGTWTGGREKAPAAL
jgi:hypothetical protein